MRRVIVLAALAVLAGCASEAERNEALASFEAEAAQPVPAAAKCHAEGVQRIRTMEATAGVTTHTENGYVIVRIGSAYAEWTPQRADTWVRLYTEGDLCASGALRRLEFQSPSGRVFARADSRGIRMSS